MNNPFDLLQNQADKIAANTVDNLASKPFRVVVSIAPDAMIFIGAILIGAVIVYKARKG